jgi:glycosyltransferase involved in cell wall biosynthesis
VGADQREVAPNTVPARASLLWIAPLTDHSGYADEARGFLRALEGQGLAPAAREYRWRDSDSGLTAADREMVRRQLARTTSGPTVAVHHAIPTGRSIAVDGAVNVTRTMFETDRIPARWVPELLERDEIWVPSRFNVETFRRAGIPESKLRVVGGTLDFDLFAPGVEPLAIDRRDDEVVFLTNFDFSERKGWRTLVRGWAAAFAADDPVRLVLKVGSFPRDGAYTRERVDAFLREVTAGTLDRVAPISLVTETLAPEDMPRLYAAADAFVMPTRGEGWGRPFMEAMAMGLPTIASRWSAQLEFMRDDTTWLVDGEIVPVPIDGEPYFGAANGHHWFDADVDVLAAVMREIAGDLVAARARAAGARADLIDRFGQQATADRIAAAADDAWERHGAPRARTVVLRGSFGSNASLAVVNDRTGDALEARGWRVRHRGATSPSCGEAAVGFTHSWPPNFAPVTDGPTVVTLPWEFGAPPVEWVEASARVDRVWAPSEYVRSGYVTGGMAPGVVQVVPNGVDIDEFAPAGPHRELERSAGCVFLFVGGTIWRKGVDLLVRAWLDAFGPDDDVLLVVKDFGTGSHYCGQTQQELLGALAARDDVAPVVYLQDEFGPGEMPSLYRAADAIVLPYRGEGFCLPALEAMACGRPVIHNGAGPTAEFVPADAGWALPARRVEVDGGGLPALAATAYVHEVDHDALVQTLRAVAADPDGRAVRGRAAREAAKAYAWGRVAERAERLLDELEAEALPLAHTVVAAAVDGHDEVVLFAPDWAGDAWRAPLERWVETFGPDDHVTLALYVGDGDVEALVARILEALAAAGHAEDALPDLAICEPGAASLAALVARASAVLIGDAADARPETHRRARRILDAAEPGALTAFAASIAAAAGLLTSV